MSSKEFTSRVKEVKLEDKEPYEKISKKKIQRPPRLILFRIAFGFQNFILLVCQTAQKMIAVFLKKLSISILIVLNMNEKQEFVICLSCSKTHAHTVTALESVEFEL